MAWKVAPALAAGCAIIFKPAEQTPLSTLLFCELIREAGYPPGAFNCVNSYGLVGGRALSQHPGIDKIAFTGSTAVGKQIAVEAAQSNLKKVRYVSFSWIIFISFHSLIDLLHYLRF